jgi:glucose/arabinose dehydrogenase
MFRYPIAMIAAAIAWASPVQAAESSRVIQTENGRIAVEGIASGLDHPWGMAFLPDGRLLVTERSGRLRLLSKDGKLSGAVPGTPKVVAQGQGGLLDVALDPEFDRNRFVYLSFSEPGDGGASTALGRGRFENDRLDGFTVIFRQAPKVSGGNHFGGRIAFSPAGHLFLTMGERFKFDPAQDLSSHLGKIVRLNRDGSVPADNPFAKRKDARPEIWSYGHRNVQGIAFQPGTNTLFTAEFGPMGGDELNVPEPGKNYGWPLVSWGRHYDGREIPNPSTRPDLTDAIRHWTPVISPSGMTFYTGDLFPKWRGNLLIGGLSSTGVVRLEMDGRKVTHEERMQLGERIRDVAQAPDGSVYLLTDERNGEVLRLAPAKYRARLQHSMPRHARCSRHV